MTGSDAALDEALARFAATGPEFGGGLSNHGPMAAEALVALGRADAVAGWSEWYARRLTEPPEARNPIAPDEWRGALGDIARAGDWVVFFDRALTDAPWPEVLETWTARLAPGIIAGATHGVLRTAHAVRSLDRGANAHRLHELAEALGYWAARYQRLPGAWQGSGALPPSEAVASVPRVAPEHAPAGLIFESVKALEADQFAPVVGYVDVSGDPGVFVSELTRTFVRHYLANADRASIAFVHSVTVPSALRILAPHLADETRQAAMAYAWQACASLYATYGGVDAREVSPAVEPVAVDLEDLADRAVAARDEHVIKFTEACFREHRLTPDPAFIVAASDIVGRFRR